MADGTRYVVQAWHYAQYEVRDGEVEVLDEDDCNLVLVAVRDSLEEAEAARAWVDACEASDGDGITCQPVAAVNVFEVPASGPPREARFVKSVAFPNWDGVTPR